MLAFSDLCEAIRQRRQIRFNYKSARCIAEPYLLGYSSAGSVVLNAWVLEHRRAYGWQQFDVPFISNVIMSHKRFLRARPDYDPYDKTIAQVIWRFESFNASSRVE